MHRVLARAASILVVAALAAALGSSTPASAQAFTSYETSLVHPVRVSGDGLRLFAVNAPEKRLQVYSLLNPSAPLLLREIAVGLDPVSVTPRTSDEVWVVNGLSDTISVVSVSQGRVVATIPMKDEPADVVFAGTPQRAFVSVAGSDEVRVLDAQTHAPVATIPIFGKGPRSLVADASGTRVYALVHKSGNRTTIIPDDAAPAPPPPTNPMLPPAPQTGLIVSLDSPQGAGLPIVLPDDDVVEIDAQTLGVVRTISGVGTINYDMALDPSTGDLVIANIESRNAVRFEPMLRGHAIDSRITRVGLGSPVTKTFVDLNPGINYNVLPNAAARAAALAEPVAVAVSGDGSRIYVAAQGTDRVGVLDATGAVLARIEMGSASGATVDTLDKRGPRGLALHPSADRLYVLNRLSHDLTVVDTQASQVIFERALGDDPTPASVRDGRKFLYDAKLSGNGTMSCASCHIDGDFDLLAWDLGDPDGDLAPVPAQPFPFSLLPPDDFHPMKGPMLTQSLRGLAPILPLHWRGDRAAFSDFNPAFDSLMGGAPIAPGDMALFAAFVAGTDLPPNPNQNLDRSLPTTPANASAATGRQLFLNNPLVSTPIGDLTCVTCHSQPDASSALIFSSSAGFVDQPMKVPQVRTLYRRVGRAQGAITSKTGFGFTHDGALDTVADFLELPVFDLTNLEEDHIEAFLLAFDTGTAPAVGHQVVLDASTAASVQGELLTLEGQAGGGAADLVAHGILFDLPRGLVFDPGTGTYVSDDPAFGPYTRAALTALAQSGDAVLVFTGAPPGDGVRLGTDRDVDGRPDGDDGLLHYGTPVTGSRGPVFLTGNREPRVDTPDFAFTSTAAPPSTLGLLVASFAAADTTGPTGIPVYVDTVGSPFGVFNLTVDAAGGAFLTAGLPNNPALAGFEMFAQGFFYDPGAVPGDFSASNGLKLTIQP